MIDNNIATQMDFDDWLQLAMNDPDAFEVARTAAIGSFLSSTPAHSRQRLTGLQWRIDMLRTRSKTPMAACQAIYNSLQPLYKADILPFQPRLKEDGELS